MVNACEYRTLADNKLTCLRKLLAHNPWNFVSAVRSCVQSDYLQSKRDSFLHNPLLQGSAESYLKMSGAEWCIDRQWEADSPKKCMDMCKLRNTGILQESPKTSEQHNDHSGCSAIGAVHFSQQGNRTKPKKHSAPGARNNWVHVVKYSQVREPIKQSLTATDTRHNPLARSFPGDRFKLRKESKTRNPRMRNEAVAQQADKFRWIH